MRSLTPCKVLLECPTFRGNAFGRHLAHLEQHQGQAALTKRPSTLSSIKHLTYNTLKISQNSALKLSNWLDSHNTCTGEIRINEYLIILNTIKFLLKCLMSLSQPPWGISQTLLNGDWATRIVWLGCKTDSLRYSKDRIKPWFLENRVTCVEMPLFSTVLSSTAIKVDSKRSVHSHNALS